MDSTVVLFPFPVWAVYLLEYVDIRIQKTEYPHGGAVGQTWRTMLLIGFHQLQLRTRIFKGLTHGDSSVCYREDFFMDLDLPLLVTVQHHRSNVHYTAMPEMGTIKPPALIGCQG